MKKILTAFVLIFLNTLPVFSQDAKIEGLGPFKIGVTDTTVIQQLCKETNKQVKKYYNYTESRKDNENIVEYCYDSLECKSGGFFISPWSNNIQVFEIKNYVILNKYDTKGVELSFLNGVLYQIKVDELDYKLIADLKIKYGEGKVTGKEKDCNCKEDGNELGLKCMSYTRKWEYNNILMNLIISENRSPLDCEQEVTSFMYLYDVSSFHTAFELNNAGQKRCEEFKKAVQKEKPKDL